MGAGSITFWDASLKRFTLRSGRVHLFFQEFLQPGKILGFEGQCVVLEALEVFILIVIVCSLTVRFLLSDGQWILSNSMT